MLPVIGVNLIANHQHEGEVFFLTPLVNNSKGFAAVFVSWPEARAEHKGEGTFLCRRRECGEGRVRTRLRALFGCGQGVIIARFGLKIVQRYYPGKTGAAIQRQGFACQPGVAQVWLLADPGIQDSLALAACPEIGALMGQPANQRAKQNGIGAHLFLLWAWGFIGLLGRLLDYVGRLNFQVTG